VPVVALLIALALAGPPRATIENVPLAVSSWCWGSRCGAPIAASTRTVTVSRGATVHVRLAFAPTGAHVSIAGRPVRAAFGSREISWRAAAGGGATITATGARGWVTYVVRLRIRP
jgi:hypothetical protein